MSDGTLNPFAGRSVAADMVERAFYATQRLRWILRKAVTRWLVAKTRRRCVGESMDLVTTEPVPKTQRVEVCDLRTRTAYVFHTQTVNRSVLQGLLHGLYGIPEPQMPKNPYTNLPWSLGQLVSIFTQIQVNLAVGRNRFLCRTLVDFRRAQYDLANFATRCQGFLRLVVARTFFGDITSHGWLLVYSETLEDVFECLELSPHPRKIFHNILTRRLPDSSLQSRWDNLVLGFWFFENYRSVPASVGASFMELVHLTRHLYRETLVALEAARPPIARARRRKNNRDTPAEETEV